jgi:hypothetical protein
MEIVSRQSAIKHNLIHYFTGKLCRRGHLEKRFTDNGACTECVYGRNINWYKENRNKRCMYNAAYQRKYPALVVARVAKYRATKYNATPVWVDLNAIKEIYKSCPSGMQVDHIVPLRGEGVSGLHVPWNLQYLTSQDNQKKSNKLYQSLSV